MEFILIFVAVIAVLVAVMTWSRRGQSIVGRESGYTVYQTRRKEQAKGTWTGPGI